MKRLGLSAFLASLLVVSMSGCGDDSVNEVKVEAPEAGAYVVFDSANSNIPYPNNILFADSTDGTLNIPYEESDADASIKAMLNELTGFSTTSPITVGFDGDIKSDTLYGNTHVYELSSTLGIVAELQFGADYVATISGDKIAIIPLKPLSGATNYSIVLTNGITDSAGKELASDIATGLLLETTPLANPSNDPDIATLELIRQATKGVVDLAVNQKQIPREDIVAAWSFRTQDIGTVQSALAANDNNNSTLLLNSADMNTSAFGRPGVANVYAGLLMNVPQFMPQSTATDPRNVFGGNFSADLSVQADVNLSVVASIPNACGAQPEAGWPVIIYQHGITRVRTDMFAYADTFAAPPLCHAVVAMDLPLHGITESNTTLNPFYSAGNERTFDIDVVTEDAENNIIGLVPDGKIDSSGTHYINLAHSSTTRDNLHQTTSDLLELENALENVTSQNAPGLEFDMTKMHFVAHSLGTIAATGYINNTETPKTITLLMPGQGIAELLNNSESYKGQIEAGLAQKGIIKGTAEYASFMLATQTIIDDADPANYAISLGQKQKGKLHTVEIVGTPGTDYLSDQTIPNSVATAPLSGTEPFLALIGAKDLNTSAILADGITMVSDGNNTVARLLKGTHGSPLLPDEATVEIHTQTATFIGANAAAIQTTDATLIKQ